VATWGFFLTQTFSISVRLDFLRHQGYRPISKMRERHRGAPDDRLDEPTGLFLSAVASPQSRLPLHPVASPYKVSNPTQVFCSIRHKICFTPTEAGREAGSIAEQRSADGIVDPPSARLVRHSKPKEGANR